MVQDVQSIEKLYEGKTIEVGYGEDKSYHIYRDTIPFPVFHGNPFLIEAVALTDMEVAGWPMPSITIKSLGDGNIQVWLIPVGESPLAMTHGSKNQLFNELFRQLSLKMIDWFQYTALRYLGVWECSRVKFISEVST